MCLKVSFTSYQSNITFPFQSDIVDVNTIFKDLATMVHEQGEFVDSIEANVESTQVRVSEGTEQLRQAEQYKVRVKRLTPCLIVKCVALISVVLFSFITANIWFILARFLISFHFSPQNKARKKKVILSIVGLIILVILIWIIATQFD